MTLWGGREGGGREGGEGGREGGGREREERATAMRSDVYSAVTAGYKNQSYCKSTENLTCSNPVHGRNCSDFIV